MSLTRSNRIALAHETLEILERGQYVTPSGKIVTLDLALCLNATRLFLPEELVAINDAVRSQNAPSETTRFEVVNETTLQGAADLTAQPDSGRVGVLNFASAKNPGGGFLNGSQAQEESLARSSGLYPSLRRARDFYAAHRDSPSLLYSDRIIVSPDCPVFRNDDGSLRELPYSVTFLTCAAPNAGAIDDKKSQEAAHIGTTLVERAGKILALAAHQQIETLILGAWGCGVFRNNPNQVAEVFAQHLLRGAYRHQFRRVRFSVLDTHPPFRIVEPFQRHFED